MDAREKLSAARLWLTDEELGRAPYLASIVLSMVQHDVEWIPTFAVTKRLVLYYNAKYVESLSVEECGAVLAHEAWHVLREHHDRCEAMQADPEIWNIANDCEINDDLALAFSLPGDCMYPSVIGAKDGLTAEEYYLIIQENKQNAPKPQHCCGSGAGNPHEQEPKDGSEAQEGRSKAEVSVIRTEVAHAAKEHCKKIENKNGRGSVPDWLATWSDGVVGKSKVRWQDKLARLGRNAVAYRAGMADYTLERPSRQQASLGFGDGVPRLHAMHSPVPEVLVVCDTSGSMGSEEYEQGLAEVDGIFRSLGTPAKFMAIDAEVQNKPTSVRSWRDVAKLLKGGGGTDFRPAFELIDVTKPTPDLVVFITDGCGPAPAHPPRRTKVIWLLVGQYRQRPYACSDGDGYSSAGEVTWGEFVEIDDNDERKGS